MANRLATRTRHSSNQHYYFTPRLLRVTRWLNNPVFNPVPSIRYSLLNTLCSTSHPTSLGIFFHFEDSGVLVYAASHWWSDPCIPGRFRPPRDTVLKNGIAWRNTPRLTEPKSEQKRLKERWHTTPTMLIPMHVRTSYGGSCPTVCGQEASVNHDSSSRTCGLTPSFSLTMTSPTLSFSRNYGVRFSVFHLYKGWQKRHTRTTVITVVQCCSFTVQTRWTFTEQDGWDLVYTLMST